MRDSEECVNDTYLKAWNSMPTQKPEFLSTYLGALTRRRAIDLFRRRNSRRRIGSQYAVALEELEDCISAGNVTEQEMDEHILREEINAWLKTISQEGRDVKFLALRRKRQKRKTALAIQVRKQMHQWRRIISIRRQFFSLQAAEM